MVRGIEGKTTPVTGQWVVLHRVGPLGSGAVDSVRTDANGAYRFAFQADTTAQYAVGALYAGVGYLGASVGPGAITSRDLGTIAVFDTSSNAPIMVSQRHLLVQPVNADGSIPVLELLVLRNPGSRTRVGADSTQPSWTGALLAGATDIDVGESDVSPDAVLRQGDSIAVLAPLTPGEKQIVLTYLVPKGRSKLVLPRPEAVGELNFMVADTLATATSGPLRNLGIASFENIRYRRLESRDVPPGSPIVVSLSRRPPQPGDLAWIVGALSALALLAALMAWWRRDRARGDWSDAEILAARIAALDAVLQATDDPERRALRQQLAHELNATLAEQDQSS